MALTKPSYIAGARIADPAVRYTWDEWKTQAAYRPADEDLLARLAPLTHRAKAALTIATAEWIIYRFEGISNDPVPFQYLESAWAANVDLAYGTYMETADDDWRGPVRGPLNIAILLVVEAVFRLQDDAGLNAAWASNLAEHVLPVASSFRQWRDRSIERLERCYTAVAPADDDFLADDDSDGDPVPREVFDPDVDFELEMTEDLINRFLSGLDYRKNPFLRSPAEMRDLGFKGKPYSFGQAGRVNRDE